MIYWKCESQMRPPDAPRQMRVRLPCPLPIIPAGQGRSSPARSKSFHRARPTLTTAGASRGRNGKRHYPKGRILTANKKTQMTYIEQFEVELIQKLDSGTDDTGAIVRWISEKVLESYRNGITVGQKGTQVARQGQSRRRGAFGKAQ